MKARFSDFDLTIIADLFRGLDLFRWVTDSQGSDLLVSPRLTLEAQLLCQRRIGGPDKEAELLMELIDSMRLGIEQAQEMAFLLGLLQQLGADGPRGRPLQECLFTNWTGADEATGEDRPLLIPG